MNDDCHENDDGVKDGYKEEEVKEKEEAKEGDEEEIEDPPPANSTTLYSLHFMCILRILQASFRYAPYKLWST